MSKQMILRLRKAEGVGDWYGGAADEGLKVKCPYRRRLRV